MLRIEDCYLAGTFTKTHGVKGELVAKKSSDLLEKYKLESVLVDIDGGLVPFFIPKKGITPRNHSSVRIQLEDLDSEAKAQRFIGCDIYILMKDVPDFIEEEEDIDPNVLIGFVYIDEERGEIGTIEDIQDYSGNIVLVLELNGQEVLIPFADENFIEINEEEKSIIMETPDGLLDMYL
ncbi:ribosome maturation factor RimM [Labilibaculum sp. DW002]|uniref:Ribosome maturation factor RimM n=1 Tax=Paralabilibaculum antarcticum TaxID=2912572 RepID=A0ABT5VUC4_9BACT|nr:ribosome maturation factor RimM [Labilibaculum sp. DW002]MDE5418407.1 ribosome maturation factor RimM [Labilibaculum sp. DW002]